MKKSIFLRTFGCQMNVRDSEIVRGLLLEKGYSFVEDYQDADIVLFNTCSVRQHAAERALSSLGALINKDKKKEKIFGLIGCVAKHLKERLFERLEGLDFICGPADIYAIPEIISRLEKQKPKSRIQMLLQDARPLDFVNPNYRATKDYAYVNISYGCDNYCSYCIVPYVRGPQVNRPPEDIFKELKSLVAQGIERVILLGQNVNAYSYRKTNLKTYDFVRLLEEVHRLEGIKKIGFLTSHPKDIRIELFKTMAGLPKIERFLHLPLQSASNRILKLMRRGYSWERYKELAERYRKIVPQGRLSTDIIVGFPTETDLDFEATRKALLEIRFNSAYIFKYSPRPPAKSSLLNDDVPDQVKEKRHRELLDLQRKISLEHKALQKERK